MAYTLKATGLATVASSVIAVDSDGTTIRDFVSATRTTNMTVHANVTKGASTWKGTSRGHFATLANGTYDFYGLTFAAGHEIPFNAAAGNAVSMFEACAGSSAGGGSNTIATNNAVDVIRLSTAKLNMNLGGPGGVGSTSLPTDGTTKFSAGANFTYGGAVEYFYGLESGSLAADGSGTDSGFGSNRPLKSIGGWSGQGNAPSKRHVFAVFPRALTLAEMQSLHDDWFGTLLEVASDAQTLTPSLYTNSNTFYAPTVAPGAVDLTPSLFTNTNAFYSATVSLSGGDQSLTPGLFSNANAFYAATVARVPGFLTPVLKNNTGTVLASETGVACNVYNSTTGALVVRKTGLTSSAAGIVSVTDAAMAAGTTYAYEIVLSAARRLPVAAA